MVYYSSVRDILHVFSDDTMEIEAEGSLMANWLSNFYILEMENTVIKPILEDSLNTQYQTQQDHMADSSEEEPLELTMKKSARGKGKQKATENKREDGKQQGKKRRGLRKGKIMSVDSPHATDMDMDIDEGNHDF